METFQVIVRFQRYINAVMISNGIFSNIEGDFRFSFNYWFSVL